MVPSYWGVQLQIARRLHTKDVVGSKMAREILRFTIETAAVGREGRICETAGAGYVRAMSALCSQ